jgi:predicted O-methyltransferase YrrM
MDRKKFFDELVWQEDRMLLGDLVFRLEHYKDDETWDLGDRCFIFFKIKALVDQYAKFWASKTNFAPRNIFELGLWDGGSLVFWFEYFHPDKHVGIDILEKENSTYFQQYIASKGIEKNIAMYWGINQSDFEKLQEIVANEFDEPLDLVIDDASHMYEATKASFETLFPLLRPGGLYIIEDWAWAHWKEFQTPVHPWSQERVLTDLIVELVEATGSSASLIGNLNIFQGFTVVERGGVGTAELGEFKIECHISRRPQYYPSRLQRMKHFLKKLIL